MPLNNPAEVQSQRHWFSRSKTRAPKFSIPLVERKRLLRMLDSVLEESISCVVAPAGFGKSTLLSQWRESLLARNIRCAWVNLDENDQEIRQFFAYLVFAFEDAGVSLGYLKKAAESGFVDMSSAAITTSLLSAIIDVDDHMVLVLDDYHRVTSEEINQFVQVLSDQCGDKIHIAIGSRTPVSINLPTLLAAGQAIEIPSASLRFSDREVKEAMGGDIDQDALTALQEQVEGWPVAVQMTRLLNPSKVAAHRKIASQGYLADYLVTNVLESQPSELREFLIETSILQSFNAELADAVCDHDKSQQFIHQLDSLQALVVPLDDELEWFRYHHLFSECVRDFLKQQDPEKFIVLHRRAAKWCGENRMIAESVNYANAIKDYDLSTQIINDNCEWMRLIYFGGVGYFNRLFANIPDEIVAEDPRLLYSKVYTCVLSGNYKRALRYHNAAEALMEQRGLSEENLRDRLTTGTGLLCRTEFEMSRNGGWLTERLTLAESFDGAPSEKDPKPVTLCCLALQCLFYGEFDKALEYTNEAGRGFGNVVALFCQINFGIIDLWTNRLEKSRSLFIDTSNYAIQMSGSQCNLKFICQTFVEAIDYWQSDLDAGSNKALEQIILRTVECDGGYEVYNVGFDAVIHDALCRKDYEKAAFLIEKLHYSADRFAMQRLSQFAEHLLIDCAVGIGNLGEAECVFESVQKWLYVDERALDQLGWRHKVTALFSCARYLKAIGLFEKAIATVDQGIEDADHLDVVLIRVRGNVLKASILESAGRREEALAVLEIAIVDAARIDCARVFAMDVSNRLLSEAVSSVLDKTKAPAVRVFAGRLAFVSAQNLFSAREEEVLQAIAMGRSNKEIARDLDLTDNTIKFHLRNIYRKLGVKKRVPAVQKARELGILK